MFELIGLVSGLLVFISYFPYIKDIFSHRATNGGLSSSWVTSGLFINKSAKPERLAWLVWSLASTVAFLAQIRLGSTASLWFVGVDMVGNYLVFLLSIKYGSGGFMKRDFFGLGIIAASVVTWYVTGDAFYALLLAIAAEAIGSGLTIWKTLESPYQETYPTWILMMVASGLAVVSVGQFNLPQLAYPVYVFLLTGGIVGSIIVGRKVRSKWSNAN